MKYYSEKLNSLYETAEECAKAEEAHDKAIAEAEAKKNALASKRAERAKEVENAYANAVNAKKAYNQILQEFLKDYGSFHATFKDVDPFLNFDLWF